VSSTCDSNPDKNLGEQAKRPIDNNLGEQAKRPIDKKLGLLWMAFLLLLGTSASAVLASSAFELSVSLSGILCVGLIAIGRREGYLIGLYNSLSYALLAYHNGLFGELYLNLFFFVPTGILGYFMWRRHSDADKTVQMRALSAKQRLFVAALCVAATGGLAWLLSLNPEQNTPWVDASTNVLSIVATFLMMLRYKEQWLLYILLNILSIAMWLLRSLAGGEAGDLMVLMWAIFLLNAVFGAWRWHQGARRAGMEQARCDAA
jgi:nicotinamide mononucleotide transporter